MAEPFLRITEIFHSIQGESTWAGVPCTFVRITGCPLRCVWCDTEYAFHGGTRMTFPEILEEVGRHPARVVEITGGEPLAHPSLELGRLPFSHRRVALLSVDEDLQRIACI